VCGIAGLLTIDGQAPPQEVLTVMSQALIHRGPDGDGAYRAEGIGMVHRRLAIIDLETGAQPLQDSEGAVLVANAEIYNHVELRAELAGTVFKSGSDCEPILPLYRLYGVEFVARLRGMYAIALYDPANRELIVSRDPFGIKPLYYAKVDEGFMFASEPSVIQASGLVTGREEPSNRDELLQLQFTTGRTTLFQGVQRVLPGETIVVRQGRVIARHRRDALPSGAPSIFKEKRALELLDATLADSVTVHQRADVPYGMFLSGGVDSAALLSVMSELNEEPVVAYTVGFEGDESDERALAGLLARKAGARHVPIEVSVEDFVQTMPRAVAAMDDPAADYAILPTYLLAATAAKDVKVVLTGEGGDELLAGYGRYRSALRPFWQGGREMRTRGVFHGLGVLRSEGTGWRVGLVAAQSIAAKGGRTKLQTAQAADCEDWLPHDLLTKVDRCLMAHGLEGRTPFLDPVVAAAVFRFDDKLKVKRGFGKYIFRRWLERRCPEAQPFAKKRGFTVPVARWIMRHNDRLGTLVASQPGIQEACIAERVPKLFTTENKRAGQASWVLLFYALWHQIHVRGISSDGDLFQVLDAR
jgi:asparagine synthase (glutamine-hydrolysing)